MTIKDHIEDVKMVDLILTKNMSITVSNRPGSNSRSHSSVTNSNLKNLLRMRYEYALKHDGVDNFDVKQECIASIRNINRDIKLLLGL